jgi:chemotaxis protein MotB
MSTSIRRKRGGLDIWPGFVDALTSLIMVLMFMLLIFAIGQFVLSDTLAGKTKSLDSLNVKISELSQQVTKNEDIRRSLDSRIAELLRLLGIAESERDRYKTTLDQQGAQAMALSNDIQALEALKRQFESEVAQLMARINAGDEASRAKDLKIAELDRQLKIVSAERVNELQKYRSEFFGKLRDALGKRDDIKVVGDRFVLPSDILYSSGSAELGAEAKGNLSRLVKTIQEVSKKIPDNIDWVLRIDGHTDKKPIATEKFPSNWELSSARAVAIVKFMVAQGVPEKHLSANGFSQYRPLDTSDTPEALAKNRRIEFQLTNP